MMMIAVSGRNRASPANCLDSLPSLILELERLALEVPRELAPKLLGELERIKATVWIRTAARFAASDARRPEREPLLTYESAAKHLGVPISRVKQAVREQSLRAVKIGHYTRFRREDLEDFVERMKLRTTK